MLRRIIGVMTRRVKNRMELPGRVVVETAKQHSVAKRWNSAAEAYWRALDLFPRRADLWVQYGHALKEQRDFEASERAYRWAAELAPHDYDPLLHLGHVLKLQGRFGEARQAFEKASNLNPEDNDIAREAFASDIDYAVVAAGHARDHQDWSVARDFFATAVAQNPSLTDIWIQLGHVCKETGAYEAAEDAYTNALSGGPLDAATWNQIGHARKLRGAFDDAVAAFARAVICGNTDPTARRDLDHLTGFCAVEAQVALHVESVEMHAQGLPADASVHVLLKEHLQKLPYSSADPTGQRRRHASLVRVAATIQPAGGMDVIWMPNIEWGYRTQRAQHLASAFAALGHRVFFISPTAEKAAAGEGSYRLIANPCAGVFEVRLRLPAGGARPLDRPVSDAEAQGLAKAVRNLCTELGASQPIIVAQHPCWQPIVAHLPHWHLVYDNLDDQTAFPNQPDEARVAHERMTDASDLLVTTSSILQAEIGGANTLLVRNAAPPAMLSKAPCKPPGGPVIGYFGALAEWFEMDWIESCARAQPGWQFVLAGEVGVCDVGLVSALPNVKLMGEVDFAMLPSLVSTFSVGIIPFRISRLTEVTDPVKLYEYLAGGCPVVASEMPEVMALSAPGVRTVSTAVAFEAAIADFLRTDSDAGRKERVEWAAGQSWSVRAATLDSAVRASLTQRRGDRGQASL